MFAHCHCKLFQHIEKCGLIRQIGQDGQISALPRRSQRCAQILRGQRRPGARGTLPVQQLAGGRFGRGDVGLVERIELHDRTGNGNCKTPAEKLPAEICLFLKRDPPGRNPAIIRLRVALPESLIGTGTENHSRNTGSRCRSVCTVQWQHAFTFLAGALSNELFNPRSKRTILFINTQMQAVAPGQTLLREPTSKCEPRIV